MSQNSDLNRVIKNAEAQGFRYFKSTSGHHQLYAPNGHDIVTHSGTPSDHRGFNNFMADLRRAGYMELHTLGDAMPLMKEPPLEETRESDKKTKLPTTALITDLLARHPEGMVYRDIAAYVRSVRPELGKSSPSNGLNNLSNRGVIVSDQGLYRLKEKGASTKTNGATSHAVTSLPAAGVRTGDASVDKDLKALDNALAALASIESVVRKNREVLIQFAKLKAMLK